MHTFVPALTRTRTCSRTTLHLAQWGHGSGWNATEIGVWSCLLRDVVYKQLVYKLVVMLMKDTLRLLLRGTDLPGSSAVLLQEEYAQQAAEGRRQGQGV